MNNDNLTLAFEAYMALTDSGRFTDDFNAICDRFEVDPDDLWDAIQDSETQVDTQDLY